MYLWTIGEKTRGRHKSIREEDVTCLSRVSEDGIVSMTYSIILKNIPGQLFLSD